MHRIHSLSEEYNPILSSGITLSHFASGSFDRQRSSTSSHTSTTFTILNPRDSKRRMEGVFAEPIFAIRLCGFTPMVEIAYERLSSALVLVIFGEQYSQQSQGFTSESFPSVFLFYFISLHGRFRTLGGAYIPAIMISHSPSASIPSGRNMLTSPTILHPLISSEESSR
jgi:hypothetical protein